MAVDCCRHWCVDTAAGVNTGTTIAYRVCVCSAVGSLLLLGYGWKSVNADQLVPPNVAMANEPPGEPRPLQQGVMHAPQSPFVTYKRRN